MFGFKRPDKTVTLTEDRYEELMEVQRAAADLVVLLIDFAGSRLEPGDNLIELKAEAGLPMAIFNQAIKELVEAINVSTSEPA